MGERASQVTWKKTFIILAAVIGSTTGVWVADRRDAVEILSTEVVGGVYPGQEMQVQYRVQRFQQCPREVYREIIDGQNKRHILGTQPRPAPAKIGYDTYTQTIFVPSSVAPGDGEYRVTIDDYCHVGHLLWPLSKHVQVPINIQALR